MVVIFTVDGSDLLHLAQRRIHQLQRRYMSTPQVKKRLTSADPRLVVERTVTSPGTMFTASSMGLVIVTSICSTGMTPLSMPMTTRGKFVSGKN